MSALDGRPQPSGSRARLPLLRGPGGSTPSGTAARPAPEILDVLRNCIHAAIAVQRLIVDAGDAIDPQWSLLGWHEIDRLLELRDEQLRLSVGASWR